MRNHKTGVMLLSGGVLLAGWALPNLAAAVTCERQVTADIAAIDQPILYNRLGASNVNGMMYALERDVITVGGVAQLRPDKRPRPLVLRIRRGDCLTITLRNALAPIANPNNVIPPQFNVLIDDQVADRHVSLHVAGLQWVTGPQDDSSYVGANADSTVAVGASRTYRLYAEKEGAFALRGLATTIGSDANQGNSGNGLIGEVVVEPTGAAIYRGQLTEEEMRLASMDLAPTSPSCGTQNLTAAGQPIIDYEARYPIANCDGINNTGADLGAAVWAAEGKAGLPIINMIDVAAGNAIVHNEINAFVAYGPSGQLSGNGHFPPGTYPLESVGKRNPAVPNRLEPFRDFASIYHDEPATAQAFPGFYNAAAAGGDDVFRYVLAGVKDGFMINYGSGGIGSEILANRLRVGPMHDCATCAYEEFFLTSFAVGDPAMLTDVAANAGIETVRPADIAAIKAGTSPFIPFLGPKATAVVYPDDPANVHHSYTGDFTKFRNVHLGKEQHVFHLHNHQWLYNPNDDNSNYIDAQGIGPGVGYTYEINNGGSGNRNKSSGDAIFHCHFYPHFAQGMWYMWRHHDVLETGTPLAASGAPGGFHTVPYALEDGTPMVHPDAGVAPGIPAGARMRALPDGEVVVGAPIPALVPLPGKPMAPMPAEVVVVPNPLTTIASLASPVAPGLPVPVGSLAKVVERPSVVVGVDGHKSITGKNPGYPFWVAGVEDVVGNRPPTPPLDMVDAGLAGALQGQVDVTVQDAAGNTVATETDLFGGLRPAQAGGWDGGLPRSALLGYAAGALAVSTESPIDFSKVVEEAQGVFFPEEGTDVEQVAMAYHAVREHPSCLPDGTCDSPTTPVKFVLNGAKPAVGAPYSEPCIDDNGVHLTTGVTGNFFSGGSATTDPKAVSGSSPFNADSPRIYKGTNLQFDVVLNKVGYHYPQQRIIALWEDAVPTITKTKAPEPLVMRLNTFDCAVYQHSNLVPEVYEMDDYQVRTPTDIIGQHIHLPKWDLTTADGAANGWNYEDGTLSPGAVRERIHALNAFPGSHQAAAGAPAEVVPVGPLTAANHPFFAGVAPAELAPLWVGARTTLQRWFADPVVNTEGVDRGLGIIFTHDHYGPSTHQQIGLYATVLVEPAGSTWVHNETGAPMYTRADGGPTSWQAVIQPPNASQSYREFYFEFSDFQHAYEAGVYVGTGQLGQPLGETTPGVPTPGFVQSTNPGLANDDVANAFRFAINPPAREQIAPVFPDLVLEVAGNTIFCPTRPCPQAIDVQDPGMFSVNYRNEPVALRIFDPNKIGPDGIPGMQADGERGDLAFALQSRRDRAIPELNRQPVAGSNINGTIFPPPINAAGVTPGDPYTPMMRSYANDLIRVKMQAGGHEEEHNATIHGVKWLQAGSGFGKAPNSGWRNAQASGISEQFTLTSPVVPEVGNRGNTQDYAWSMDASNDGWWSGMWGIFRSYENRRNDLVQLANTQVPFVIGNRRDFNGVCPRTAPVRRYDITAVLANDVLVANPNVTIQDLSPLNPVTGLPTDHIGNVALDPLGGTLVYNPRTTTVGGQTIVDPETGLVTVLPTHNGPLHDPTAILYVRTADIDPVTGKLFPNVRVEPLVLRAAAGDCLDIILRNGLPPLQQAVDLATGAPVFAADGVTPVLNSAVPDLPTYSSLLGVVKRDRLGLQGSTTLQNNLIRASGYVGLHPQLVAYDVTTADGVMVGNNAGANGVVAPGGQTRVSWYAGDINPRLVGTRIQLDVTPIEFGGVNLQPADKVKQGAKSLVGALVIEPRGATWNEDADDTTGRQTATVTANGTTFRDFSAVFTKALTQYYADSSPVEHMNGEGVGIPEDSQEASNMAINYGIEPLWFRAGILPQSPFGKGGYADVNPQSDLYSNARVGGNPATPLFLANRNQPFRMRVTNAFGTSRGSTFALHGHVWQRDPYVCVNANGTPKVKDGLAGRCATTEVGSTAIGNNPIGFAQGGQESITPSAHFDIVPTQTGLPGDYLFRDFASFGNASGLWGIVRVQ